MSALGQKRTFRSAIGMSALPPKADMCDATRDVRYGPRADIRTAADNSLFDDIIGKRNQRWRHAKSERLGRF
jgi:hypothetical protein